MERVKLGKSGPEVSRIGLGCMAFSGVYGPAERKESIATIHHALDKGVTLLDTGDFYGMGHNERLLGEALVGVPRESYLLSVKFGGLRDPAGGWVGHDARPQSVKNFLAYSLERLGTDYIDIYRPARLDPHVPIEETVGAIADCVEAGWVRHIGVSELGAESIRKAAAVHPICDLQIEYALFTRGIEDEILPTCRELGIGITAYGVFSRGLIGGNFRPDDPAHAAIHAHWPRFSPENAANNLAVNERMEEVGAKYGLTAAQLSLAWVAAQGKDIVPLVGTRKAARIDAAIEALKIVLSADDLAEIERAVPPDAVAGSRYAPMQMAMLDSER